MLHRKGATSSRLAQRKVIACLHSFVCAGIFCHTAHNTPFVAYIHAHKYSYLSTFKQIRECHSVRLFFIFYKWQAAQGCDGHEHSWTQPWALPFLSSALARAPWMLRKTCTIDSLCSRTATNRWNKSCSPRLLSFLIFFNNIIDIRYWNQWLQKLARQNLCDCSPVFHV